MQPTIHLERKAVYGSGNIQLYLPTVLWVAFSIPSGSLLFLNHLVYQGVQLLCFKARLGAIAQG
jgi:hypothetical protein